MLNNYYGIVGRDTSQLSRNIGDGVQNEMPFAENKHANCTTNTTEGNDHSMGTANFATRKNTEVTPIVIGAQDLSQSDAFKIIFEDAQISLCDTAFADLAKSRQLLEEHSKENIVYGLNTGFGPMASRRISPESQEELQFNLIRSHALGMGKAIPEIFVRATLLCRLVGFLKGHSGVSDDLVHLIVSFLNFRIHPIIPEHGGVGASGDLVQLAHIGLALIGEGNVCMDGKELPAPEAFAQAELSPLVPQGRDGLAILNGVSAMTGIGLINVIGAERLLSWSVAASCLLLEVINSPHDPIHPELNRRKRHVGQRTIAATMEQLLSDSQCLRSNGMSLEGQSNGSGEFRENVQEHYSIRCTPQILGPIFDTISHTRDVVMDEANSVSDNPVLCPEIDMILHGGNFHGDYVALEMDKLKISTVKLSMLCERQLDFLMNDQLNNRFPPFMNLGTLGLNLGLQGAQFAATSTAAENQTLAFPMYVHSIPTNKGNQDVVSMGTNAALMANRVIQNTFEVIAIELIALIQAVDYTQSHEKLSTSTRALYETLRDIVPMFKEDTLTAEQIQALRVHIENQNAIPFDSESASTPHSEK